MQAPLSRSATTCLPAGRCARERNDSQRNATIRNETQRFATKRKGLQRFAKVCKVAQIHSPLPQQDLVISHLPAGRQVASFPFFSLPACPSCLAGCRPHAGRHRRERNGTKRNRLEPPGTVGNDWERTRNPQTLGRQSLVDLPPSISRFFGPACLSRQPCPQNANSRECCECCESFHDVIRANSPDLSPACRHLPAGRQGQAFAFSK